ncbi:MAG: relaxase [Peptococcaceae bacterium]|nr:relaxase [Peptococcaceae bacterium]
MNAPFMMKLSFYTPSPYNRGSNQAHIRYIATKPEADRGDPEVGDRNYRVEPELDPETAAGHVHYVGTRPGSHGLFGPEDKAPDMRQVEKELGQHEGIVWRFVLSLREDDAQQLGYVDRKSWEEVLRATVPEAAEKMGIYDSNLRWVAAFHEKQGHPHVHLVVWEKEPKRTRGMLSKGERTDVRKAFIKQIFAKERARLGAEKTAIRDMVREVARGDLAEARKLIRDVHEARLEMDALHGGTPGVPPILYSDQRKELARRLDVLTSQMPGKGRIALKYMPENVRQSAKDAADWILRQPGFAHSVERYQQIAREMASHYSLRADALHKAGENAYIDLRDRVAQVILKEAGNINRADRHDKITKARTVRMVWRAAWQAVERERTRIEAQSLMEKRAQDLQKLQRAREVDREIRRSKGR